MALLKIRTCPDPTLRKKSQNIGAVGEEEKKIINNMAETMYTNGGIGLAAPQVGVLKRIIVVDVGDGLLKLINPEIISKKGTSVLDEGCLSLPERLVEIERADEVSVSFIDEENTPITKTFKGLTARAIQHEIDHLNGKLIIDYLPWYKRVFPKRGEVKCLQ